MVLGYRSSRDTLFLLATGEQGLVEMKTRFVPGEIHFGLLRVDHRVLLWTFLPEDSVSGVRRARALVHSRAVAAHFRAHHATLTAGSLPDLSISAVRQKLKLDGSGSGSGGSTSGPPSPLPDAPVPTPPAVPVKGIEGLGISDDGPPTPPPPPPPTDADESAKREREHAAERRSAQEREARSRWESEQRERERLDSEERVRLEKAELARRDAGDRLRREEQRRAEQVEQARKQHEQDKRRDDDERRAQDEQARTREANDELARLVEHERREQAAREDDERRRAQARRDDERRTLVARFEQADKEGAVILTGHVTVQGGNSVYWKRRWFELRSADLKLYKSQSETSKPLEQIALLDRVRAITDDPEEAAIANSFKLAFLGADDDGDFLFYTDEKDDKELLVHALRIAAHFK